ncbi:MAG TPA: fibronectin type III domain-containing protein [Terriglobales bacterium]|nr:fibronectin type III domain-containing protein [Terriglobales bacterium]
MPACPRVRTLPANVMQASDLGTSGLVTVALYAVNRQGEGAGWSNPVTVPLTQVGPPPDLLSVQPTAAGVQLHWRLPTPIPARIAVYRGGERIAELDGNASSYLDDRMQWNQHYQYWLRSGAGLGDEAVESADSQHRDADTRDVFPPPVPAGLQAVAGVGGVDLSWNAVNAPDLAGYIVYRQAAGAGNWEKRNGALAPTPVYHDPATPGHYTYAVTAVDRAGNESPRSAPVDVSVSLNSTVTPGSKSPPGVGELTVSRFLPSVRGNAREFSNPIGALARPRRYPRFGATRRAAPA